MDFMEDREIKSLKSEIEGKESELSAERFYFEKKLNGDYGKKMLSDLESLENEVVVENTEIKKKGFFRRLISHLCGF